MNDPREPDGSDRYDVLVIGGGPAGASVAALTARNGRRTLLLERDPVPRFKIGESLMPGTYEIFRRIGVLDKLKKSPFQRKHSVQFINKSGRASVPFYFEENDPHERSVTWQVLRSEFDQMLLDNAEERGANVVRGAKVLRVLFQGEQAVGAEVKFPDGAVRRMESTVTVDASGQSALLQRHLGERSYEPRLKKAALYSHFENARRDAGIDEGATLVIHTQDAESWFWNIPLHDNVVSIGVVGDAEKLLGGRGTDLEQIFQVELEKCPAMQERLGQASQRFPIRAVKEFSYRSARLAGDGWVLVGDAFGFLDPIYSSGVFLALKSGECAADAIEEAFRSNDFSGRRLGDFGEDFGAAMESIRRLVYAFYTRGFSFSKFLNRYPHHRQALVDLLIGNVYRRDFRSFFDDLAIMCPSIQSPAKSIG